MGRTRGPVRPGPARPPRRPGPRDAAPQLAAAELADDDPRAARRGLRPPTPAAARTEPGRRPQAPKQPGPEPPEGDPLMPRRWLTRQLQQLRLVPALLVPTARAIGWAPPLAAVALYAQPGSPGWAAAHQRWAMLLGVALAAFAVASRDPAHGHVRSRIRNRFRRLARSRVAGSRLPGVRDAEPGTTRPLP